MNVKRKFTPGSEWLYLKIYTGIKTSDLILEDAINPLVLYFREKNLIQKWFFIRYYDPKPHLRVRFEINDIEDYNEILQSVNEMLKRFVDSSEISKIIIDSYVREIERYGESTMEYAEELFCNSSDLTLHFLEYNDEEKIVVSMFYIEEMLSALDFSSAEKFELSDISNKAFKNEFNADKKLNSQLNRKYRDFRPKYADFLHSDQLHEVRKLIRNNISESVSSHVLQFNNIKLAIDFFQSIFHMHINRTFTSEQRLFEMIIYGYLFKHSKRIH
ncbi:thiopeptide-type bacteriocin biosynthesis protein [Epilithonimonas hungarica]|uniref:thiopeptide-type bacteriocin biosynthesis protein n=1 Tax=Epilithonimonas hungarica TaxID=454006 RepID=UPI00278204BD|nr:thiopeptide-type bacteriocin biosynthesis protein [Epilithonimonas hungarica]MDP9956600.1 thiopeptide-type bacteriocin biosynthesis protein [Epilithonimonas hungarica]